MQQSVRRCTNNGTFDKFFHHEVLPRAAERGDAKAHYRLALEYFGRMVKTKKAVYHMEEAAIRGAPEARHHIGIFEMGKGRYDR